MMRAARDQISAEIDGMTLEEELRWLASGGRFPISGTFQYLGLV
jgi:hypothetical protein